MLCKNPYLAPGLVPYGCGQCVPCLVNRRRVWTHRLLLEQKDHDDSFFLTLTYDDDYLPRDGSLEPRELQLFIKRYRRSLHPHKIRFFAIGEYGETTLRPHYHLAVYGGKGCEKGITDVDRHGYCCDTCERVRGIWSRGIVHLGELNDSTATYLAGYVTKKLTKSCVKLDGKTPEFQRMSNRPGIGASFTWDVASAYLEHGLELKVVDVDNRLRHGKWKKPLGRYLTRRLRKQIGRDEKAPQEVLDKMDEQLRPLREEAAKNAPMGFKSLFFKAVLQREAMGRQAQIDARVRAANNRRTGI